MITIKDIGKYTNISISTISRALRNPESVSEKKRLLIFDAVEKLGYIPNYYASNLKSHKSYNIGLIVNDVQNPFFNKLIQSIEQNLANDQFKLLIAFGLSEKNSIDDKIKNFLASSVAGIMFSPNQTNDNIEKLFKQQGVYALQLFTKMYDSLDSIVVDDFLGTYLATKRLLYSGHKNILIIGLNEIACVERINGYIKAFDDFSLTATPNNIFLIDDKEYLTEKICTKIVACHPTAIITISDIIGIKTIKALRKLSLSIPNDISLIHYDDSSWADLMNITTIGHPIDILGQTISKALINGIKNPDKLEVLAQKIEPIILERNSVKNIDK